MNRLLDLLRRALHASLYEDWRTWDWASILLVALIVTWLLILVGAVAGLCAGPPPVVPLEASCTP